MADPMVMHPLDTDLLDFVELVGDVATKQLIKAHLADCVICRIKVQRLRNSNLIEVTPLGEMTAPSFAPLEVEDVASESARPGELWLTAADEAAMVLVRSVRGRGSGVVVVPVITDVEVADRGARIVDATASPVGVPIAIYDRLVVSLPSAALLGRIVPTKDVDVLALTDGDLGVSRGSPLEDPSDPRIEIRQHLIDRLTALDPLLSSVGDDPELPESSPAEAALSLRDGLAVYRGDWCVVEALEDFPSLPRRPLGWAPVARVSEFGIRLIVVRTPGGLTNHSDFVAAQALLLRLDASAVVVTNGFSDTVDLYDPPTLFEGFEVPAGERTSYPLLEGLSLVDAIAKFLDRKSRSAFAFGSSGVHADVIDVEQVLSAQMAQSIAAAVKNASRLGEDKKRGVLRLDGLEDDLAEALKAALRSDFDVAAITAIVDRSDQ